MIFNGNGKTIPELKLALDLGVMVNIDSKFDLEHISSAAQERKVTANVLLRIKPDIDVEVHPYIATGLRESKFGIPIGDIETMVDQIRSRPFLNLLGFHCHLGSTVINLGAFKQTMGLLMKNFNRYHQKGYPLKYLNIGGGLAIDYHRDRRTIPTPADLVSSIAGMLPEDAVLILEPGRSIVGTAGVMICEVIGVKMGQEKNFIVTDGSMAELIRPSLYQAYHHIHFTEPVSGPEATFDIAGPVCESADFLGKVRKLPIPSEGAGVAIFDTGAYGMVMSSNYNGRMRPPEFIVDGEQLIQIRKAESLEDHLHLYEIKE
jgi:diaminopimelate decarboxylase